MEAGVAVIQCGLLSEDLKYLKGSQKQKFSDHLRSGLKSQIWIKPGPPDQKRYTLCIYKDESSCNKGGNPEVEVELLKVLSVQPDPARSEVFIINYLEKNKAGKTRVFSHQPHPPFWINDDQY